MTMREIPSVPRAEMRQNAIDRIVSFFNPQAGFARLRARSALSGAASAAGGYKGGRRDRRATRNWRMKAASVATETLPDLPDLRTRSRDLERNVPVATGAIATVETNVVGSGLVPRPEIDWEFLGLSREAAQQWHRTALREWNLYRRSCDFSRSLPHAELQGLALRSVLLSGDVLLVRRFRRDKGDTYGTKIQLVEADRVSNADRLQDSPERQGGVRFAGGIPIGYEVASRHPDDFRAGTAGLTWSYVPRFDGASGRPIAQLLFKHLRPDQPRGVPYFAPVIESFKLLGDYTDAEVRAAAMAAMFTVFIEQDADTGSTEGSTLGSDDSDDVADPEREVALEDAGAIVRLDPGEKVNTANPGRPNPVFGQAVDAFLRQMGVALELPFEVLIKHFTASYSASRAALEMAWQFFRIRRTWLGERFCQPTWEWFLEEAVALGRIDAPGFFDDPLIRMAYCRTSGWVGATKPNLNPKIESEADEIDLRMGVKTRDQIITERTGGDFESKNRQLVEEQEARSGLAVAPPATGGSAAQDDGGPDNSDAQERRA